MNRSVETPTAAKPTLQQPLATAIKPNGFTILDNNNPTQVGARPGEGVIGANPGGGCGNGCAGGACRGCQVKLILNQANRLAEARKERDQIVAASRVNAPLNGAYINGFNSPSQPATLTASQREGGSKAAAPNPGRDAGNASQNSASRNSTINSSHQANNPQATLATHQAQVVGIPSQPTATPQTTTNLAGKTSQPVAAVATTSLSPHSPSPQADANASRAAEATLGHSTSPQATLSSATLSSGRGYEAQKIEAQPQPPTFTQAAPLSQSPGFTYGSTSFGSAPSSPENLLMAWSRSETGGASQPPSTAPAGFYKYLGNAPDVFLFSGSRIDRSSFFNSPTREASRHKRVALLDHKGRAPNIKPDLKTRVTTKLEVELPKDLTPKAITPSKKIIAVQTKLNNPPKEKDSQLPQTATPRTSHNRLIADKKTIAADKKTIAADKKTIAADKKTIAKEGDLKEQNPLGNAAKSSLKNGSSSERLSSGKGAAAEVNATKSAATRLTSPQELEAIRVKIAQIDLAKDTPHKAILAKRTTEQAIEQNIYQRRMLKEIAALKKNLEKQTPKTLLERNRRERAIRELRAVEEELIRLMQLYQVDGDTLELLNELKEEKLLALKTGKKSLIKGVLNPRRSLAIISKRIEAASQIKLSSKKVLRSIAKIKRLITLFIPSNFIPSNFVRSNFMLSKKSTVAKKSTMAASATGEVTIS